MIQYEKSDDIAFVDLGVLSLSDRDVSQYDVGEYEKVWFECASSDYVYFSYKDNGDRILYQSDYEFKNIVEMLRMDSFEVTTCDDTYCYLRYSKNKEKTYARYNVKTGNYEYIGIDEKESLSTKATSKYDCVIKRQLLFQEYSKITITDKETGISKTVDRDKLLEDEVSKNLDDLNLFPTIYDVCLEYDKIFIMTYSYDYVIVYNYDFETEKIEYVSWLNTYEKEYLKCFYIGN